MTGNQLGEELEENVEGSLDMDLIRGWVKELTHAGVVMTYEPKGRSDNKSKASVRATLGLPTILFF